MLSILELFPSSAWTIVVASSDQRLSSHSSPECPPFECSIQDIWCYIFVSVLTYDWTRQGVNGMLDGELLDPVLALWLRRWLQCRKKMPPVVDMCI